MNSDRSLGGRKRGRALSIFGAMVADGFIVLWLLGGPWQWLLGAGVGLFLTAVGIVRGSRNSIDRNSVYRKATPSQSSSS